MSCDQWFRKRKRLTLKFLDCRLTGALSVAEEAICSSSPSLEEMTELPNPASEVTRSNSAAKIASLSEIRDFACLVNRNMVFSISVVVEYNTTTAKCKPLDYYKQVLFAGVTRSFGLAAYPGKAKCQNKRNQAFHPISG